MPPLGGEDGDELLDQMYEFLESGEPDRALATARIAMRREGEDPVLHFLAGQALLDLDQSGEAVEELSRAVELDPEDPEFRARLAYALFLCGRFDDASKEARRATETDPNCPDGLDVKGLTLEREGKFAEADDLFRRASRLDPDRFPEPQRLSADEFEAVLVDALDELREQPAFGSHVNEVAVTVEDIPSDEVLFEDRSTLDPELLGLFVGTARNEIGWQGPMAGMPPRILLFKRNLERFCLQRDQLRDEIVRTLRHEFAHYLGFEEEDMPGLDLD